jgi:hypothetical protein
VECLRCGHKSESATIRCTACGANFPRAAFEELTRIRSVLNEATRWAHLGLISEETLGAIERFYQPQREHLEDQMGLRPSVVPGDLSPQVKPLEVPSEVPEISAMEEVPFPPSPPAPTEREPALQPAPTPRWERVWSWLGAPEDDLTRPARNRAAPPPAPPITW